MHFTLILIFQLVLLSCGNERMQNANKDIFRYNESGGITSLDPAYARSIENIRAVHHLFNGLVSRDEKMNIVPCIARDWEVSEDGKIYTFFLRNDVYFHAHHLFKNGVGRNVVARDFVYSFQRIMDSETASPGAWIFSNIDIDIDNSRFLGFEAPEKYTLRIHLKEPFQPFLGLLTMKYCSVIPHEIVEEYGDDFRINPIGTGPFRFKIWKEGNKLVLVRNLNYFEKDEEGEPLPYLDAINISFLNDEEVEYLEFLKGNFDYISGTNASNREFIAGTGDLKQKYSGKFDVFRQPYLNTEYLGILMDTSLYREENSPLKNKLIRKAMAIGFNRRDMVKFLKNGVGTPAEEGFIPKGLPPYANDWIDGHHYNPDSARKLLEMAGYPMGKGLSEIKLHTTSQYLTLCEYVQSQLSEIGIKVRIELNPAATNNELIALSKVSFFRKSWIADYPDAENYMALFYSKNFSPAGPNYFHFKNEEYDELYERVRIEPDRKKRMEFYHRMESIIIEEIPVIPLYYDGVVGYVQTEVKGLRGNPMNMLYLKSVIK